MPLLRRFTALASALLVVLVQLALAGGGVVACAEHPAAASSGVHAGMADMGGMPGHDGADSAPAGDCADAGMPDDDCRAMASCTSIVAMAADVVTAVVNDVPPGAVRGAQLAPHSLALRPEAPPPRA